MGLDQYGFARKEGLKDTQIMYWRKHSNLEGWMHDLYYEKGGTDEFNCVELSLTKEDLLRLKADYKSLEEASGFFWGSSQASDDVDTGRFIELALVALDEGYEVIYTSWW